MDKDTLLKYIAKTGYNVGFGAKKHFATYDMVEKVPGLISIISIGVGIFALINDFLAKDFISAAFLFLGILGLYISFWDPKKLEYEKSGVELTQLLNDLEKLYHTVKGSDECALEGIEEKVSAIQSQYYAEALSKQILFSNWYAHYKFFWEHQIDWIDEQLHFKLLRDKVPLSLMVCLAISILVAFSVFIWKFYALKEFVCA